MDYYQAKTHVLDAARVQATEMGEYVESMRHYPFADQTRQAVAERLRQLREAMSIIERSE